MSELLNEELNLNLLENLCSGIGVSVNIGKLSRNLKKHRNTIKDKVTELIKYKVINPSVSAEIIFHPASFENLIF